MKLRDIFKVCEKCGTICCDCDREKENKSALSDGVSLRDCDCEGFRKYNNILNAQQVFAAMRGMEYPAEGIFIYCPWCGKKREAS